MRAKVRAAVVALLGGCNVGSWEQCMLWGAICCVLPAGLASLMVVSYLDAL